MYRKLIINFVIIMVLTVLINLIFRSQIQDLQGHLVVAKYVLIGVGCGLFVSVGSGVINQIRFNRNADYAESVEIDLNDERNIQVNNTAKAKVFDLCGLLLGPLFILVSFTSSSFLTIIVVITFSIIALIYYLIVYSNLQKEM